MLARLRSAVLLIALLGLIASLTTAMPASAEDNTPAVPVTPAAATDTDDDGVLDAATTAAASTAAAAGNKPVEDLSQRTETTSVVANADGSFTSKEFGTPIRVKQDGEWVDVDYALAKQADGSWAPKAAPVDVSIDGGSAKEAARVTFDDGKSMAVTWPSNLPEPTVKGGVATYKLSTASDLIVAVTSGGLNARIRLNERPAADDSVFTLGLRTEGVDLDQTSTGGLKVSDDGKTIAKTSNLIAWDATTDRAGDPAHIVDLAADLDQTGTSGDTTTHTLDLTTPDGFLSDPSTVYPVTIDPDISMTKTRDTWVRSGDTVQHGADYKLLVGKLAPSTNTNPGPTRSYLKFYSGAIEKNPNIEVVSAELGLFQYYAYNCGARRMYAYPVVTSWADTTTWANKPDVLSGNGATNVENAVGAPGCEANWTKLNLTAMASLWANGTIDMQGIRLSTASETDSAYERRFCSMDTDSSTTCNTPAKTPYIATTYNSYPSAAATPVASSTFNPVTASVPVSDPDGGNVRARYLVKRGTTTIFDGYSSYVASGSQAVLQLPPLTDGTYTVQAWANDGTLSSKAGSGIRTFAVNTSSTSPSSEITPSAPYRIADTTSGTAGPATAFSAGETRTYQVTNQAGVPAGATGVLLHIATTSSTASTSAAGSVAVTPSGRHDPTTPALRFSSGSPRSSTTLVSKLSSTGRIDVFNAAGSTNLTVDMLGYLKSPGTSGNGNFTTSTPTAVLDTATGLGSLTQPLAVGASQWVDLSQDDIVPATATAVWVTVDVTNPNQAGSLFLNDGTDWPYPTRKAWTLDYGSGVTKSTTALVKLDSSRRFRVLNSSTGSPVDLKAQVVGFVGPSNSHRGAYHAVDTQELLTGTLAAGETRTISALDLPGVEDQYIGAVAVRIAATNWTADGTVEIVNPDLPDDMPSLLKFGSTSSATRAVGVAASAFATTAGDGNFEVRNTSSQPVTISVAAQGWTNLPTQAYEDDIVVEGDDVEDFSPKVRAMNSAADGSTPSFAVEIPAGYGLQTGSKLPSLRLSDSTDQEVGRFVPVVVDSSGALVPSTISSSSATTITVSFTQTSGLTYPLTAIPNYNATPKIEAAPDANEQYTPANQEEPLQPNPDPGTDPAIEGEPASTTSDTEDLEPPASAIGTLRPSEVKVPSAYAAMRANARIPKSLRDYCTSSKDTWNGASFKGPCAKHDICIWKNRKKWVWQYRYGCDSTMWYDLMNNCRAAYSYYNPNRYTCFVVAESYYAVITARTAYLSAFPW